MNRFELTAAHVDLAAQREALKHPGSGGFCAFEGWVRDTNEGRQVSGLEYEAYTELAIAEGERILAEAAARYGVLAASAVHRVGTLGIGDLAVWIGVSAPHRDEAFRACRYIIDEIKHRLPIWKKEHYLEGDHAWVACSHTERAHEHEPPHIHAPTPEETGTHRLAAAEESLDPGFRRGDEQARATPDTPTTVVPANAGTQRLVAAEEGAQRLPTTDESPAPSRRRHDEQETFLPDYSRQVRLREVGDAGQRKLADARVLVIGAGGLGVPVIGYLAGAGVGTLGIVDGDTLEASNLHRQVMYDARDVGQRKVDLAAQRVAALNPSVQVTTYPRPLHAGDIAEVVAQYDLVVECTDDLASRYLANDAAVLTGTPLVLASVYQYEGQLQVVTAVPGEPCLRCLWPEPPAPALAGSCATSGVLGPVPGVLGTMQAMEALKLLLGLPRPADHALQLVDLLGGTSQRLPIDATQGCAGHGGCVAVARRALEQARGGQDIERRFAHLDLAVAEGFAVVDVREADEIAAAPLRVSSLHIPSGVIAETPLDPLHGPVLLVCASGRRSLHAAHALRRRGVDAWSLAGGATGLLRPVAS